MFCLLFGMPMNCGQKNLLQEYRDVKIHFSFASFKLPIISFAISLETDEKTCDVLEVGAFTYMDYYFDIIRRIFI